LTSQSADSPHPATPKPLSKSWFNPIARFLGPAYLRNAFTKGTEQEVEFLVDALAMAAGQRVLDVGCGPGRHSLALARRGMEVVGVDLSPDFVKLAREAAAAQGLRAEFEILDVRDLAYDAEFDAAICLCQGGFGLLGGADDAAVVAQIVRAVRPEGGVAITAFSSYFAVRGLEDGETFDPVTGVLHEISTVRDDDGQERDFDAWTTCFTTRELWLVGAASGLAVGGVYGVAPGRYRRHAPTLDDPELLLVGRRAPG
jgi:SAM-dependent methyltransferase